MSNNEQIDAGLARISGRLSAQRDRVRAELEKDPELLVLAEGLREAFGARLTWLQTDTFETGREIPPGIVPAEAVKVKRRGRP